MLSLATTFLGILLTVGYVDLVLHQHEVRLWHGARERLHMRLERIANVTWSQFRVAFGFNACIVDLTAAASRNAVVRRTEMIRVAENVVAPAVREGVRRLDASSWRRLSEQIRITWEGVEKFLGVYGHRLPPVAVESLMRIQDHLNEILTRYSTFPDVIGVSDEALPASAGHDRVAQRSAIEELMARDVEGAIEAATRLLRWLNQGALAREGRQYGA